MKLKLLVIPLLASLISLNANATSVLYKSFDNLVDESEHVIGGVVSDMQAKAYKNGEIYTVITFKDAYIVTDAGEVPTNRPIHIRYKGGEVIVRNKKGENVGVEGIHANGTPELNIGENVILFVNKNGIADMPIYGWEQGVFYVDGSGGINDARNLPVVGLDGADILVKKGNAIVSKNKTKYVSASELKSGNAELLESDGGKDVVIDNVQENAMAVQKLSSYNAIHISNFISMIQERKAARTGKGGIVKADNASLFKLPPVHSDKSSRAANGNKVIAPQATKGSNGTVAPLVQPKTNDKGE